MHVNVYNLLYGMCWDYAVAAGCHNVPDSTCVCHQVRAPQQQPGRFKCALRAPLVMRLCPSGCRAPRLQLPYQINQPNNNWFTPAAGGHTRGSGHACSEPHGGQVDRCVGSARCDATPGDGRSSATLEFGPRCYTSPDHAGRV